MKKIGFTGTSKGMTPEQETEVYRLLKMYFDAGYREFHHGQCIGADEQAARIAAKIGYIVVAHPGYNPKNPTCRMFRSDFAGNNQVREEKPFIKRDRDIVDETERMIATPLTCEEVIRSGTWTTVRYARKKKRPIDIVYPARD